MKQNHSLLYCTHSTTNYNLEQFPINKQWLAEDIRGCKVNIKNKQYKFTLHSGYPNDKSQWNLFYQCNNYLKSHAHIFVSVVSLTWEIIHHKL